MRNHTISLPHRGRWHGDSRDGGSETVTEGVPRRREPVIQSRIKTKRDRIRTEVPIQPRLSRYIEFSVKSRCVINRGGGGE